MGKKWAPNIHSTGIYRLIHKQSKTCEYIIRVIDYPLEDQYFKSQVIAYVIPKGFWWGDYDAVEIKDKLFNILYG